MLTHVLKLTSYIHDYINIPTHIAVILYAYISSKTDHSGI